MTTIELDQNISCVCSDDVVDGDMCSICGGTGNLKVLDGKLYRHYKGDVYQILGTALDANDGTPLILYRRADCLSSALGAMSPIYVHRLENFFKTVAPGIRRFTKTQ